MTQRVSEEIVIKSILVRDKSKLRAIEYSKDLLTESVDDILNDPEISIVVELIGGEKPAYDYIVKALKGKKNSDNS